MFLRIECTLSYSLTRVGVRVRTTDNKFYDVPMELLITDNYYLAIIDEFANHRLEDVNGQLITEEEYRGKVKVEQQPPYNLVKEVQMYLNHEVDWFKKQNNISIESQEPSPQGRGLKGMFSRVKSNGSDLAQGTAYWNKHAKLYKEYYKKVNKKRKEQLA